MLKKQNLKNELTRVRIAVGGQHLFLFFVFLLIKFASFHALLYIGISLSLTHPLSIYLCVRLG